MGPLWSSSQCGHIELTSNWPVQDRLNLVDQLRLDTSHHKVIVFREQNGKQNCSIPLGLVGQGPRLVITCGW